LEDVAKLIVREVKKKCRNLSFTPTDMGDLEGYLIEKLWTNYIRNYDSNRSSIKVFINNSIHYYTMKYSKKVLRGTKYTDRVIDYTNGEEISIGQALLRELDTSLLGKVYSNIVVEPTDKPFKDDTNIEEEVIDSFTDCRVTRLYQEGYSIKEISNLTGLYYSKVRSILLKGM